ncbi:hypothetical protein AMTR_s00024p00158510 [Amborella trichopoda]|uniref:Uncharacterized protein n=1 Tax=Amborella trichopoda TaxID=13333 RepID=W1PTE8_AMBTC|nr:hypothetical protein AMTR_s00024p00158510 [Amborella trichopoda]
MTTVGRSCYCLTRDVRHLIAFNIDRERERESGHHSYSDSPEGDDDASQEPQCKCKILEWDDRSRLHGHERTGLGSGEEKKWEQVLNIQIGAVQHHHLRSQGPILLLGNIFTMDL